MYANWLTGAFDLYDELIRKNAPELSAAIKIKYLSLIFLFKISRLILKNIKTNLISMMSNNSSFWIKLKKIGLFLETAND